MSKIKLDVDSLAVESFATTDGGAKARGTVQGHAGEPPRTLYQSPCISLTGDLECQCVYTATPQYSCNAVCEGTENDCLSISGHLDCPCQLTG